MNNKNRLGDLRSSSSDWNEVKAALPCLVVATSAVRNASLCQAARAAGWLPIPCSEVGAAVANYERVLIRLVIVDLHSPGNQSELHEFLEWLAALRDPLLVILGCDGDISQEIWARQLGPWMYLTGTIEPNELSLHLKSARRKAELEVLV